MEETAPAEAAAALMLVRRLWVLTLALVALPEPALTPLGAAVVMTVAGRLTATPLVPVAVVGAAPLLPTLLARAPIASLPGAAPGLEPALPALALRSRFGMRASCCALRRDAARSTASRLRLGRCACDWACCCCCC